MGFAGNKAAVIEACFRYPHHKGFLITLHVLLFNELLNTALWIAIKDSALHSSKKCGWPAFKFRTPVLQVLEDHVDTRDSYPFSGPLSAVEED
jgi:hypothetical protein